LEEPDVADSAPQRALDPIEGIGDLVRILRYAEYRDDGCSFELVQKLGVPQPSAAVIELRRRGYKIEEIGEGPERTMRLLETPGVGSKRRKRQQLRIV
jgi:Helix-turn-helix domain